MAIECNKSGRDSTERKSTQTGKYLIQGISVKLSVQLVDIFDKISGILQIVNQLPAASVTVQLFRLNLIVLIKNCLNNILTLNTSIL